MSINIVDTHAEPHTVVLQSKCSETSKQNISIFDASKLRMLFVDLNFLIKIFHRFFQKKLYQFLHPNQANQLN